MHKPIFSDFSTMLGKYTLFFGIFGLTAENVIYLEKFLLQRKNVAPCCFSYKYATFRKRILLKNSVYHAEIMEYYMAADFLRSNIRIMLDL